jgi:hypothetical protein
MNSFRLSNLRYPSVGPNELGIPNNTSQAVAVTATVQDTVQQLRDSAIDNIITSITNPQVINVNPLSSVTDTPFSQLGDISLNRDSTPSQVLNITNELGTDPISSNKRPVILSLMDFKPIWAPYNIGNNNNLYLTNEGEYFDSEIKYARHKKNSIESILRLDGRPSPRITQMLEDKKNEFENKFNSIKDISAFLINTLYKSSDVVSSLNLNSTTAIETSYVRSLIFSSLRRSRGREFLEGVQNLGIQDKFTIHDIFGSLGYSSNYTKTFSNTKCWLQFLYDFNGILNYQSNDIINSKPQQRDNNQTTITKTQYRSINPLVNDMTIGTFLSISPSSYSQYIRTIETTYNTIYSNMPFETFENKVSFLTNLISKEFAYSKALGSNEVKRFFKDSYSTTINDDSNRFFLNSVCGNIGNSITEQPVGEPYSLSSTAYKNNGTNSYLLFENKEVYSQSKNYFTGKQYLCDSVLTTYANFNRIDMSVQRTLSTEFNEKKSNFIRLCTELFPDIIGYGSQDALEGILENDLGVPMKTLNNIIGTFFSNDGVLKGVMKDDPVSVIFTVASYSQKVKSILYTYFSLKFTQAPSIHTNEILKTLITDLTNEVNQYVRSRTRRLTAGDDRTTLVSVESIFNSLALFNSELLLNVNSAYRSIFQQFTSSGLFSSGKKTRYHGLSDLEISMISFDFIVTLIGNLSNRSIVNVTVDKGIQSYTIVIKNRDRNKQSILRMKQLLSNERDLLLKSIYYVIGTLDYASKTLQSFISFYESESSLSALERIIQLLPSRSLLLSLFQEQQVHLICNITDDIVKELDDFGNDLDINNDEQFNENESLKLLDDIALKKNILSMVKLSLSLSDFLEKKRIVSIAIPAGFTSELKQEVSSYITKSTSFNKRESDFVKVKLFKVDNYNPDIILKPIERIYEMSRFVVRSDSYVKNLIYTNNLLSVLRSMPFRDYSTGANNSIKYYENDITAVFNENYSFLSNEEKIDVLKNHFYSFVLDCYVRIMTGLSISEDKFNSVQSDVIITDPQFVTDLTDLYIQEISNSVQLTIDDDSLFDIAIDDIVNQVQGNTLNSTLSVGDNFIFNQLSSLANIARIMSNISDADKVMSRIITPKKFDRIFNILFSDNEFEIDFEKTNSNEISKSIFQKMLSDGNIVVLDGKYYINESSQSQQFFKYFVVIEEYGDDSE